MAISKGWLDSTPKKDLLEFNEEEAVGWIVSRLNSIESDMVDIICNFYNPQDVIHFRHILLNNSVLGFGAKLKVLRNIPEFDSKIVEKLAMLSAIRNGFAHVMPHQSISVYVEENNVTPSHVEVNTVIDVMNSNGLVKSKSYIDYMLEFQKLYNDVKDYTIKATQLRFGSK